MFRSARRTVAESTNEAPSSESHSNCVNDGSSNHRSSCYENGTSSYGRFLLSSPFVGGGFRGLASLSNSEGIPNGLSCSLFAGTGYAVDRELTHERLQNVIKTERLNRAQCEAEAARADRALHAAKQELVELRKVLDWPESGSSPCCPASMKDEVRAKAQKIVLHSQVAATKELMERITFLSKELEKERELRHRIAADLDALSEHIASKRSLGEENVPHPKIDFQAELIRYQIENRKLKESVQLMETNQKHAESRVDQLETQLKLCRTKNADLERQFKESRSKLTESQYVSEPYAKYTSTLDDSPASSAVENHDSVSDPENDEDDENSVDLDSLEQQLRLMSESDHMLLEKLLASE